VTEVIRRAPAGTALAYARLAKLDVFDYYLGLLIVWSLLPPAARTDGRALATLVVFGLGEVALLAALVAFDDVTGFRDGSDGVNYGPDAPARRLARKPLLAGTLTQAQAIRFGWACTTAAVLLWTVALLLAPHRPMWAVAGVAVTLVLGVQYSWGLKLSYHGMQELFVTALGWALLLPPYGLVAGHSGGFVVVQALLFGLGPLLFGVYSNTNDIAGDRGVRRPTVAASVPPRGNAAFIAALSAAETALILAAPVLGVAPWWFPVAMLPVPVLRAVQYGTGMVAGQVLRARKLGIWIHRCAVLLLVAVDLVAGGLR
jgi:1,4-dihydroxy-2-naphthoate octaprenyltransferase